MIAKAMDRAAVKLNLGCGTSIFPSDDGWVNLDFQEGPGVDIVHDLTNLPWPVASGSVDFIVASHIFEHLPASYVEVGRGRMVDSFYAAMNECWRVLRPGGFVNIEVPTVGGNAAFQDQTHRRYFVPECWDYVSRGLPKIPNTQAKREGVADGLPLGAYKAATGIMLGVRDPKAVTHEHQRMLVEKIQAEMEKNAKKAAGEMAFDWGWYKADYGIECRFDCLVNIVDSGKQRFNFVILRKPVEGEE